MLQAAQCMAHQRTEAEWSAIYGFSSVFAQNERGNPCDCDDSETVQINKKEVYMKMYGSLRANENGYL